MKILKICISEWLGESRDKRELSICRELGADVQVMAKGEPGDTFKADTASGFEVLRFSTRPLGIKLPNGLNRIASVFTWSHYARSLDADIISGHDISGLLIGYLSNCFKPKRRKAKLVYDSHEFEIGRSGERSKAAKWLVTRMERFLMKRCAFSIMVNDSIADEVQRIHRRRQRPVVVRNIPPLWEKDEDECRRVRREFCEALRIPEDTFLAMYHGGVIQNRGVENMLRAIALTPGIAGVVLGNGEASYLKQLHTLAEELGVAGRVLFYPAVPVEILKNYVGAVDCGLVILQNVCVNHYYSLPNKFFENIQSETPVIGSDFPEISRLVKQYRIGLLCDPESPAEIAGCLQKMRDDPAFYSQCKDSLKTAKRELCWENEKKVLTEAYARFLPSPAKK